MSANLNFKELAKRYYKDIRFRFGKNMINTLKIVTTCAIGAAAIKCVMDTEIDPDTNAIAIALAATLGVAVFE